MEESSSDSEHDLPDNALEDTEEIHKEDFMNEDEEQLPDIDMEEDVEVEACDFDIEGEESPLKDVVKISYDVKLRELLRNLSSLEIKIYSEAAKEFVRLLRSDSGGDLLNQYVHASPLCSELMEAWKIRQGKPGVAYVISLISAILDHPNGVYKPDDLVRITLSRRLDKLARTIIETKLGDVYTELTSKEVRRQSAVLSLMAAIVRRGVGLASEVAKTFDFKLSGFPKLAEYQKKVVAGKKGKYSTRRSFIEFALSFLKVGNPRLLRWILQQKDMYFNVLRCLGSDDDEIVDDVLTTLRDKVLIPDSLVPPGLRSVLFGSVTLDQLVTISGRPLGGSPAVIAHEVLVMVCTDPQNGLMPDFMARKYQFKGNPRRLLELMKKLRATEIDYHRDLLLAIVNGRPFLGSEYMDKFPYDLSPRATSTWFSAISLAADLVSSSRTSIPFGSLVSQPYDPPSIESLEVQGLMKCMIPRAFTRTVINKGLLNPDILVRHGSLRLLLEALKSLDSLIGTVEYSSGSANPPLQKCESFKLEIQDAARALLPDPQVLLNLFHSVSHEDTTSQEPNFERSREYKEMIDIHPKKKRKTTPVLVNDDSDIHISGICAEADNDIPKERGEDTGAFIGEELENEKDHVKVIASIWGVHNSSTLGNGVKDVEAYFRSKLLDALTLYLRTMPTALEGQHDFFKMLPSDPFTLSIGQQQSLLSLLIEYSGSSPGSRASSIRLPEKMYKRLKQLLNLLMFSPVKGIQDQAYILARLAILSTGGFDRNHIEIDAWLLFLPGYRRDKSTLGSQGVEVFQDWSATVLSFLCDAISTMGNDLHKYINKLRVCISNLQDIEDASPDFSPLFICILDKCLGLLDSDSGPSKPSKSSMISMVQKKVMISMYVNNTLSYILQTQVDGKLLSDLISMILTKRLGNCSSVSNEWIPLKNLLVFSGSLSHKNMGHSLSPGAQNISSGRSPLSVTLEKTKKSITKVIGGSLLEVTKGFCFSIICATPDEILAEFPSVVSVAVHLLGADISFLSCALFNEQSLLASIADQWPDLLFPAFKLVEAAVDTCKKDEVISRIDFSSTGSASVAFSCFLKQAPFFVLFPAIMKVGGCNLLCSTKIVDLLQAKLSEGSPDGSVASVRLLLFWAHQLQTSYRLQSSEELQQLYETCFVLVRHILAQLLIMNSDISSSKTVKAPVMSFYFKEVVETIFSHPAVTLSFSWPLCSTKKLINGSLGHNFEDVLGSLEGSTHLMENHMLHFLKEIAENLLAVGNDQKFASDVDKAAHQRLVKPLKTLIQQVVVVFKNKFEVCLEKKDLLPLCPAYYTLRSLIRFISPFTLLEIVHWMFCKVGCNRELECLEISTFSIGCYIAGVAFDLLSSYLDQLNTETERVSLLWQVEGGSFDGSLLEKVYSKVTECAMHGKVECADSCLLKAVKVVYRQKILPPQRALPPFIMSMWRVILSSPIQLLDHCINRTNATRAKLLSLLTEVSPLHLSLFGQKISRIMKTELSLQPDNKHNLTDEEFVMLLPVALSYLDLHNVKFGVHFGSIPSFYSRILLDGFLSWKSYVSQNIFQEEYDKLLPSSTQELLNMFYASLLGKAIYMLQYYYTLNVDPMSRERMELFKSICPCSGKHEDLLDCDINEIIVYSPQQLLNVINRVIAKVYICKMLLFLTEPMEAVGNPKELSFGVGHNRLRFFGLLVHTLHNVVKRFPLATDNSENLKSTTSSMLFRYLEEFILRNIVELAAQMPNDIINSDFIHNLDEFSRSSLLHRFEDPATLKALRYVLSSLSEGIFSFEIVFELLLAHSRFIPSILWSYSSPESSGALPTGTLFRSMSSILKYPALLFTNQNGVDNKLEVSCSYKRKLEVIKLLRVLYHLKNRQSKSSRGVDAGMNPTELFCLLFSCYGATVNEIDLEIFDLLREIVSTEGSECVDFAEMDYLWGNSVSKIRRERKLESSMIDCETVEEYRRRQFRENIPFDSKLCASTIFNFPYDRGAESRPLSLMKDLQVDFFDVPETSSASIRRVQQYDPAFIMRFSFYGLSAGYLEPLEFVGLGLLAIAFMSISSSNEGIRELGYKVLGRFKNALENCRNRKDGLRIRLLLTYLQNGVKSPLQRIPSMTAIFASEASFVLLDPSHAQYHTVIKLLMRSPRVNLESIPLFHTMFGSISVNFKADRIWILRLSYAGLNLNDDAKIFREKGLLEILLSFYASSLSDSESKMIVLQIVKKSVKLPVLAHYLVEHCSLILWLSSIFCFCGEKLCDGDSPFLAQMTIVLEVVNDIISLKAKWLQKHALEQVSEFSSHSVKILVGSFKKIKQHARPLLEVLVSILKISQKRKLYQPHFTLSFDGLYQLVKAIEDESNGSGSGRSIELGLTVILMSAPPAIIYYMDGAKLLRLILWGTSTPLKSSSRESWLKESVEVVNYSGKQYSEESLMSKLLRWVTASIILGRISRISYKIKALLFAECSSISNLQLLLEHITEGNLEGRENCLGEVTGTNCSSGEVLAALVLYLQQLIGLDLDLLPSVVSAVCLLLISSDSDSTGRFSLIGDQGSVLASLCSKIRCPAEANLSWRWSFYEPWKDLSFEFTEIQKMEEYNACQSLLIIFSNYLSRKSLNPILSHKDVEDSGIFAWEMNLLTAK